MITNSMQYRGYTAAIQYEDEDGLFYGDVLDLRDTITFSGSSVEELRQAFHTVVDDYVEHCKSQGEQPEKPFSGRFVVRLDPSLHRRASVAAGAQHLSLNTFIIRAIEREVAAPKPGNPGAASEWFITLLPRQLHSVQARDVPLPTPFATHAVHERRTPTTRSWTEVKGQETAFARGETYVAA